ncbi:hypothetical protein TrCOL_g9080 [Triparma columacea]|uniref:EF-hand domain-containing protein n=1 Tax=Triparma columacea TaxID=722753 RepID=A0A9W7GCI8_9STRA|nr:hypothetical protein TrCOL_g9080 [Triparma columacea]
MSESSSSNREKRRESSHPASESTPLFVQRLESTEWREGMSKPEIASWYVEAAIRGKVPPEVQGKTREDRQNYVKFEKSQNPERPIVLTVLIALTFLELPLWCNPSTLQCNPPNDPDSQVYLSQLPYLSPLVSCSTEIVCYLFLLYLSYLELKFYKSFNSLPPTSKASTSLALLALADSVFYFLISSLLSMPQPLFRLAPYVRIVLLSLLPTVFNSLKSSFSILPSFFDVLVLLITFYLFYGWVLAMLLDDVDDYLPRCLSTSPDPSSCPKANDGFSSLTSAIYTMATAATNADVPDTQLPSYSHSRPIGVAWLVFYVVGNFFLLNLVLAQVYFCYKENLTKFVFSFFRNRANGLKKAYEVLTESNQVPGVTKSQMVHLVRNINESEVIQEIPIAHVQYLFHSLDSDRSGFIDLKEFYDLCEMLQNSYTVTRTESWVMRTFPRMSSSLGLGRLKAYVLDESRSGLQSLVTSVLLLNSSCIFLESMQDLYNIQIANEDVWGWVEFGFSIVYAGELCVKLATIPFTKYWIKTANRFDFFVTVVLLTVSIVWAAPSVPVPQEALRYFTILRLLRLLELIKQTKRFSFISTCLANIAKGSTPVMLSVFVATSIFGILGSHIYGGLVYGNNPDLKDSEYFSSNLDVLNFNDFSMSLMTLLAVIVSGGPITNLIEGHGLVGWGGENVAVMFFFTFYYLVLLVLFNVFIAFVIEGIIIGFSGQMLVENEAKEGRRKEQGVEEGVEAGRKGVETVSIPVEVGFEVIPNTAKGSDLLYKSMFANELKQILG